MGRGGQEPGLLRVQRRGDGGRVLAVVGGSGG